MSPKPKDMADLLGEKKNVWRNPITGLFLHHQLTAQLAKLQMFSDAFRVSQVSAIIKLIGSDWFPPRSALRCSIPTLQTKARLATGFCCALPVGGAMETVNLRLPTLFPVCFLLVPDRVVLVID